MKQRNDVLNLKASDQVRYGLPRQISVQKWGNTFSGVVLGGGQLTGSIYFSLDYSEPGGEQDIRRHFTDAVSGFWEVIEISESIGQQEALAGYSQLLIDQLHRTLGEDWSEVRDEREDLSAETRIIWSSYMRAYNRAKRLIAASAAKAAYFIGKERGPNPSAARASLLHADLQLLQIVLPHLHKTKRSNITRMSNVAQAIDTESQIMDRLVTRLTEFPDEPWEVTKNHVRRLLREPSVKPFIYVSYMLSGPLETMSREEFARFALQVIEFELASAVFKPARQLANASDRLIEALWAEPNFKSELGQLMFVLQNTRIGEPYDDLLAKMRQRAHRLLEVLLDRDWPAARDEATALKRLFSNRSTDLQEIPPEWYPIRTSRKENHAV